MSERNSEEIRQKSANVRRALAQRPMVDLSAKAAEIAKRKKKELAAAVASGEVPEEQPKAVRPLDKSAILSKLWKKRFPQVLIDEYLTANDSHTLEDLLDMEPTDVQAMLHRPRRSF